MSAPMIDTEDLYRAGALTGLLASGRTDHGQVVIDAAAIGDMMYRDVTTKSPAYRACRQRLLAQLAEVPLDRVETFTRAEVEQLMLENIGLTQELAAVKRQAVERRQAMEAEHAEKVRAICGQVKIAEDALGGLNIF
jgi:hypothetical protein